MEVGVGERTFQTEKPMKAREGVVSAYDAFKKLSHPVAYVGALQGRGKEDEGSSQRTCTC